MVRVLPSPTEINVAIKEGKRSFINIEKEVFNLEVGVKRAFFSPPYLSWSVWCEERRQAWIPITEAVMLCLCRHEVCTSADLNYYGRV